MFYQFQAVTVSQFPFLWKLLPATKAATSACDFVVFAFVVVDLCFNLNKTSCQCGILFLVLCSLLSERSEDFRTGGGYNGECSNAIMPIWIGTSEYWYISNCDNKKKLFHVTHIKFNDTLARSPCDTACKCWQPRKSYSDWYRSCILKQYSRLCSVSLSASRISRLCLASSVFLSMFYCMQCLRLLSNATLILLHLNLTKKDATEGAVAP